MQTAREFLERFVRPFLGGGDVWVGEPIALARLQKWILELAIEEEHTHAVFEIRHTACEQMTPNFCELGFSEHELTLCVCVHNLLFLAHPSALDASSNVRKKLMGNLRGLISRVPSCETFEAFGRHSLLQNLSEVGRKDVLVAWWTGSREFHGQAPPGRLLTWKKVRRVRTAEKTIVNQDLLSSNEAVAVTNLLLRRSPLTQLLWPYESSGVHWESCIEVLRDTWCARYLASQLVGTEFLSRNVARLATGLDQMLERSPPARDVTTVVSFLVYLQHAMILGSPSRAEEETTQLARKLSKDQENLRERGLATFLALPLACRKAAPELARVPGSDALGLSDRMHVLQQIVQERLGESVIHSLAMRLAGRLGTSHSLTTS